MRESANANCKKRIAAMRNAGGYSAVTHAAAAAAICRRDVSAISDGLSYFLRLDVMCGFFWEKRFFRKKSSAKKAPFFSSDFIRKNTFSTHFCHITSRENKIEQNRFSQKKGSHNVEP